MKAVTKLNVPLFRGYEIGYKQRMRDGWVACWKLPDDDEWREGHIIVDAVDEIEALAKECIDFNCKVANLEQLIGLSIHVGDLSTPIVANTLVLLDWAYKMARHVANVDSLPAVTWGARGMDLLAELRAMCPAMYDREIALNPRKQQGR